MIFMATTPVTGVRIDPDLLVAARRALKLPDNATPTTIVRTAIVTVAGDMDACTNMFHDDFGRVGCAECKKEVK